MAAHGIQEYFTPEEVARLEEGLPHLERWSGHILVPFHGYRLPSCRVAWLNRRWFQERLFDIRDSSVHSRICAWILGDFAYIAVPDADRSKVLSHDTRTLWADRYGSSQGLAVHGGSGRATVTGAFQAKGVGRTPLVSPEAPSGHSHGCLSLADAIREAIFSEIASAEFPHGAVPVIAIIDTALSFSSPDPDDEFDQDTPRAILVRPSAVRIAHAERASLFKKSITGFANVQAADVLRTKEIIDAWMASPDDRGCQTTDHQKLQALFENVVEQIAFGQVFRLFSGGYFSSNLTLSGELLDFGNMHALSNWSRAQVHSVVEGFGSEMLLLRNLVMSVTFHVFKYRNLENYLTAGIVLYERLEQSYRTAWKKYCLMVFQAGKTPKFVQDALHTLLLGYYGSQQRLTLKYRFGETVSASVKEQPVWLYDSLVTHATGVAVAVEAKVLEAIDRLLREHASVQQRTVAWQTASRLLSPRQTLNRRRLLVELDTLTRDSCKRYAPEVIADYVQAAVDGGRRFWPRLPNGYPVLAHTTRDGCSALLLSGDTKRHCRLWVEGIVEHEKGLRLFDQTLTEKHGVLLGVQKRERHWSAIVDARAERGELVVRLPDAMVRVPEMTVFYQVPIAVS